MSFFDPLKPDRPEFDAIDTDSAKTLFWSPPPAARADFVLPPKPPAPRTKITKLPKLPSGTSLVEDILLDSERRADERKGSWWKRLWSR